MSITLTVWVGTGLAIALSPAFRMVLLLRLLQGAAAAGVFIVTVTLIGDLFEGVQRNAVIGMKEATLLIGAAIAPLIGGVVVEYGWNIPFAVFIVGFLVAVFALYARSVCNRMDPTYSRKRLSPRHVGHTYS